MARTRGCARPRVQRWPAAGAAPEALPRRAPGTVRHHWADGTAGDFHYVPEGGIHAFRNADPDTPASMLILFAPATPRERNVDGLAEIIASGRQLSEQEWTKFYAENDQYMV
jgi:hypothetical protein